jgi:hypothetical protein
VYIYFIFYIQVLVLVVLYSLSHDLRPLISNKSSASKRVEGAQTKENRHQIHDPKQTMQTFVASSVTLLLITRIEPLSFNMRKISSNKRNQTRSYPTNSSLPHSTTLTIRLCFVIPAISHIINAAILCPLLPCHEVIGIVCCANMLQNILQLLKRPPQQR